MRRLELLIAESRSATENTEFNSTTGIQDLEFIRWANDAQERIHNRIVQVYPSVFKVEKEFSAVAGQEAYDLPSDCFLRTRIEVVEYTRTGQAKDYCPLPQITQRERFNALNGWPSRYIRRDDQILLQPAPDSSGGKIRINYYKKLPKLDIRRGQVLSASLDTVTNTITSLNIDPATLTDENIQIIQNESYMCVVDKDGAIKMQGIPVAAIDQTTGLVTLDGAFTFESGETIPVGAYIVRGALATTHPELDDQSERYIVAHMDWKALKRDSSNDSPEQTQELETMLAEIVDAYKTADEDIKTVPIIDYEFLGYP